MKKLIIGLFVLGLTTLSFSQDLNNGIEETELKGVVVIAPNYNYLMSAVDENTSPSVKKLQLEAASFDVRNLENYDPIIDSYEVTFKQSNGKILATYDENGKLKNSFEKYKNVILPRAVLSTVFNDNIVDGWKITKDTYRVRYTQNNDVKRIYKVELRKGKLKKNLKIETDGKSAYLTENSN